MSFDLDEFLRGARLGRYRLPGPESQPEPVPRPLAPEPALGIAHGRPTKRDRRTLEQWARSAATSPPPHATSSIASALRSPRSAAAQQSATAPVGTDVNIHVTPRGLARPAAPMRGKTSSAAAAPHAPPPAVASRRAPSSPKGAAAMAAAAAGEASQQRSAATAAE